MKFLLTLGLGFILGVYVHVKMSSNQPLLPDMSSLSSSSNATPSSAPKSSAGAIVHGIAKGSQHI